MDALAGLRLSSVFNYERGICITFVGSFSADRSKVSLIGVRFISRLPVSTSRRAELFDLPDRYRNEASFVNTLRNSSLRLAVAHG